MNKVTLCENTLEPSTWTTFEDVADVRSFLVDHFGIWPETARIYLDHVAINADITPHDPAGVERLGKVKGHIFVVVYPEGIEIILLVIALVVAAVAIGLSFLFRPSANTKTTQESSSNNHLSDRQNTARPNERIPDIFGELWATPDLLAVPYRVFVQNQEYEYCYMCLGRGVYEIDRIREDVTDVQDIDGYSCEVYAPFTSPNSGDSPIERIGPAINTRVFNLQPFGAVNGQILQPPNATFKGNGSDIKFVYPDQIVNDGTDDFTNYFNDPVAVGHDVYIKIGGLRSNDDTASDPGFSVHSTHLHGTYKVASVGPNVIVLVSPGSVNGNWAVINTFLGHQSRFALVAADSAGVNLIAVGPTGGDNLLNFTDKFKMLYPQMTELWCNFVCPQGCYKVDKNGNQLAPLITLAVRVQSCDLNGNPIGSSFLTTTVLEGSVNDRSQKGVTLKVVLPDGFASNGGILVDVRRASDEDHSDGVQINDQVQWRDCYIISPVTQKDFGNVTTIQTIVRPTPEALQIKERKLNCLVTRAVSLFGGVVPGPEFVSFPFDADTTVNASVVSIPKRIVLSPDRLTAFVFASPADVIYRFDLSANAFVAKGVFDPSTLPGGLGAAWTAAGGPNTGGNGDPLFNAFDNEVIIDSNNNIWGFITIAGTNYAICYDGFSFKGLHATATAATVDGTAIDVPFGLNFYSVGAVLIEMHQFTSADVHLIRVRRMSDGSLVGYGVVKVTGGIFSGGLSTGFPLDTSANLILEQRMPLVDGAGNIYVLTHGQHITSGVPYTTYDWYIHRFGMIGGVTFVGPFAPAFQSVDVHRFTGDASLGKGVAMIYDAVTHCLFVFTDTGCIHKVDPTTWTIVQTIGTGASPAYVYAAGGYPNKLSGSGTNGGAIAAQNGTAHGILYVPDITEVGHQCSFQGLNTSDLSLKAIYDVSTRIPSTAFFLDSFIFDDIFNTMLVSTNIPVDLLGTPTSYLEVDRVYWNPAGTPIFKPLGASKNAADIIVMMSLDPFIGNRKVEEIDVVGIHLLLDPGGIIETYFDVFGYPSAPCEFCYTFDDSKVSYEESLADVATAVFCVAYRRGSIIMLAFEQETDNSTLLFNHRNKIPKSETRTVSFGALNDQDGITLDYIEPNAPNYPDLDTTVTLYFPADQSAKNPKKVTSIGIRNKYQAAILGFRMLQKVLLQNTIVQFDSTQEAALCVLNDRILVADNTRSDVQDGEVIGQASLVLTLSQDFVDDGIQAYTIFLQHPDQTVESIGIIAGPDSNQVILASPPSTPLVVDAQMYARSTYLIVGDAPTRKSSMLIQEKNPKSGLQYEVKAVNYSDDYYSHDRDFVSAGGFGTDFGRFGE